MDAATITLGIVGIFALVIIAALLVYRHRGSFGITMPGGTGVTFTGENPSPAAAPGVRIADATSRKGGLTATDETGRGADVQRVDVEGDMRASSSPPRASQDPKA